MEWGVGPGGGVPHRGCCPAGKSPAWHIPEGTLPGSVRFQGRVARYVIRNWPHVLLDRDQCGQRGQQAPAPQAQLPQVTLQQVKRAEPAPEGTGGYPSSALLGAPLPLSRGRQSPDQAPDLAGWTSGELPGQVTEQLASWPPGTDQPPAGA
jgi:hypothetical protein